MVTPVLVWPGFDPGVAAGSRALRRRVARVRRRPLTATGSLALAADALGITPPPRGPIARLADSGARDERAWFLAEPVRLVADRDRLRLVRLGEDGLDPAESAALAAAAGQHFADVLVLERGVSGQWYFACADVADADLLAPDAAARAEAFEAIPRGADGRRLARVLTELQMLWHEHPVNRARGAAGRPQANALWVWDGGRLPAPPELEVRTRVFGNAREIAGLAAWLGLEHAPLAAPGRIAGSRDCVLVIESGEAPLGQEWLRSLDAERSAFDLFMDGGALTFPARGRFRLHRRS